MTFKLDNDNKKKTMIILGLGLAVIVCIIIILTMAVSNKLNNNNAVELTATEEETSYGSWYDGQYHLSVDDFATIIQNNIDNYISEGGVSLVGSDDEKAIITLTDKYSNKMYIILEDVDSENDTIGKIHLVSESYSTDSEREFIVYSGIMIIQITNTGLSQIEALEILEDAIDVGTNYTYKDDLVYESNMAGGWLLSIYSND